MWKQTHPTFFSQWKTKEEMNAILPPFESGRCSCHNRSKYHNGYHMNYDSRSYV